MALVLTAAPAAAGSPHRIVVIVAAVGDARAALQHALLERDAAALRERDVMVEDATPEEAARRALGVDPAPTFAVLLIGRDGKVKLRCGAPVAASEITALIDTMPMRREEMRRRSGG